MSGTSMASPHVAGVAALVIKSGIVSNGNGLYGVADEVRARMNSTADPLGDATWYGNGLVDADEAAGVSAPVNQPPVAEAGVPYSGTTGSAILFSSEGSHDPDGTITSYDWAFGDGTHGSGASVTHTYDAVKAYTVTLTVTDNGGLTDTDTAIVTVTEPISGDTMHISSISVTCATKKAGKNTFYLATAVVTAVDGNGSGVVGVTVSGHWSGLTTDIDTGITGVDGKVSLTSDSTKKTGTFTFNVDGLVKSGWTYAPSLNVEDSDFVSTP